ncbi:prolyl 4-hydroxylase subunit alpha-1-like [Branchiostoma floridae]|uniref:procollagen-proline 4-dioxygenase n=1 Tax=Branchiostoma floridae TaxID=7739 RepID=A0A9J7HHM6_BRAFL|nr:prolyl 4-hydroxylase subunit alpha-1-like [Branchiostoma floridae]XP_035658564.1 prolyl 4-hydroxylase subunit alpha-1-like [Branchiostoma floridae]XP_035658565.1 prolyl 4-hydroxylase subunit alpha-1-like [Branchiostoma floridae]
MALLPVGIILLFLVQTSVDAEVFTALCDMEYLVHMEKDLVESLDQYIQHEEDKLNRIKTFQSRVKKVSQMAMEEPSTHLHHPVNAYLLVKRYTREWPLLEAWIQEDTAEHFLNNMSKVKESFPSFEDYMGAGIALLRLQDTYDLSTQNIANGKMSSEIAIATRLDTGFTKSPELSSEDCFEVGLLAYNDQDYYHVALWMEESLARFQPDPTSEHTKDAILDHLAYASYRLNNIERAYQATKELLRVNPEHSNAVNHMKFLTKEMEKSRNLVAPQEDEVEDVGFTERGEYKRDLAKDYDPGSRVYELLCQVDQPEIFNITPSRVKHLKCRYFTNNNHPRLLLAPIRLEQVFDKPKLWVLHNILSDPEMEVIKKLAQPRLQPAATQNPTTGGAVLSSYRISKNAWLYYWEHRLINRVKQRVEDVTGLTMETAEPLQVINYGIGGHYEPHFDCATKDEEFELDPNEGDRIATMLFYMSDVEAGGATVFPQVGARVVPEKGAGAFWYNLLKSGEGDMLTEHAGCPVLVGSKWVSNMWIHERGQEFRRKCGLYPEE